MIECLKKNPLNPHLQAQFTKILNQHFKRLLAHKL